MTINAQKTDCKQLNEKIQGSKTNVLITDCYGERFIGCGAKDKKITINGTPGNALGAYLDGASIVVNGNVQDAVGDTMNDGKIIVKGNAGDALGYAMRGGKIYIRGNAGYRTGIHMKQYHNKKPVIVVGGSAGSFLGEYLAGGLIIVLGLSCEGFPAGNFTGTGMHGGEMIIRSDEKPKSLPEQVSVQRANDKDMKRVIEHIEDYCKYFECNIDEILNKPFYRLTPNAKNPYKQLYTQN